MVTRRDVWKGTATRYLPAVALGQAALIALLFAILVKPGDKFHFGSLASNAVVCGLFTVGFAAALTALRKWLRPDASVTGRQTVVAWLLTPAAYLCAQLVLPTTNPLGAEMARVALGGVLAVGMFFPWLRLRDISGAAQEEAASLRRENELLMVGEGSPLTEDVLRDIATNREPLRK